jgi:hypothetical protein
MTPLKYPQKGIGEGDMGLDCSYEEFMQKREQYKKGNITP